MGKRLAAAFGGQGHVAGAQASGLQYSRVGVDDARRALAKEVDGQAGGDRLGVSGGADHRGIERQVGQTHEHGACNDPSQPLEIRVWRQRQARRPEADFQDFDAEHPRKRVMRLDQGEKFLQRDARGMWGGRGFVVSGRRHGVSGRNIYMEEVTGHHAVRRATRLHRINCHLKIGAETKS